MPPMMPLDRRLVKEFERYAEIAWAPVQIAIIKLITRSPGLIR
jgi:hypothetical protein